MTTSTSTIVAQADTVLAVTREICRRVLAQADALKVLPSTRRDLAAVVADAEPPHYFNYMTLGEMDYRTHDCGFERTQVTLRLDFDRVQDDNAPRQTEVSSDGARYMVQRLRVWVEEAQMTRDLSSLRQHIEHLQLVASFVAEIEAEFGGRDLYLLLATAEEAAAQETQRQRSMLTYFVETECKGLRVGQTRQVLCDVAAKLPGVAWPSTHVGVEANVTKCGARAYDLMVGNVGVTVTRTM